MPWAVKYNMNIFYVGTFFVFIIPFCEYYMIFS